MNEALAPLPRPRREFLTPEVSGDDVLVLPDAAPPPPPSTAALLTRGAPPAPVLAPPRLDPPLEVLAFPSSPGAAPRPRTSAATPGVLAGAHTARGKPILANDPHLGFGMPGVWYPLRIEPVDGDGAVQRWIQGVTPAGIPGLVIFQNDRLAIGFTNTGTDVQDLYREPEVGQRVETIRVKGAPSETLTVSLGRHGPMVRPGLALAWAALDPATLRAPMARLMLATDWTSLNAAADGFLGPGQNLMYADAAGHMDGARRASSRSARPGTTGGPRSTDRLPRTTGPGYLAQDRMPRVLDPPSGRLVTANQRAIGTSIGFRWPSTWASPTRARRIVEAGRRRGDRRPPGPGDAGGRRGRRPSGGRPEARAAPPPRGGPRLRGLGRTGRRRLHPLPGGGGDPPPRLRGGPRRGAAGLGGQAGGAPLVRQRSHPSRGGAGLARGMATCGPGRPRRGARSSGARGRARRGVGAEEPPRGDAPVRTSGGLLGMGVQSAVPAALRAATAASGWRRPSSGRACAWWWTSRTRTRPRWSFPSASRATSGARTASTSSATGSGDPDGTRTLLHAPSADRRWSSSHEAFRRPVRGARPTTSTNAKVAAMAPLLPRGAARRRRLGALVPHRPAAEAAPRRAAARGLGAASCGDPGLALRGVLRGGGRPRGDDRPAARRTAPGRASRTRRPSRAGWRSGSSPCAAGPPRSSGAR